MVELGESSRGADVEFVDVQVDTERMISQGPTEPYVPVPADSDDEDFSDVPLPEPIRGRVLRTGIGSDDSEPEEDSVPESDPEEILPEAVDEEVAPPVSPVYSPVFPIYQSAIYPDGMGSTADDIIEGMTTFQGQLEDRIHHLEAENQVLQDREQQYRDLVHQTLGEKGELTQRLAERDGRIALLEGQLLQGQQAEQTGGMTGPLIHRLVTRSAEMRLRMEQMELETAGLQEELEALRARCERESLYNAFMWQDLTRAEERTRMLQAELHRRESGTDTFDLAPTTSSGRQRRRMLGRVVRRELRRVARRGRR